MSVNSNFKKDKCWSCEFYCGKREYNKGVFLGDSVYTDGKGTCSNKRSDKNGSEVYEDGWCSRYQKWGVLQSALAVEAQKRESERIEAEQRREMRRIQEENERREQEIECERRRLEEERIRLEYGCWYNSLSPEEKAAEDARIEEVKRREVERIAELRRKEEERRTEEARLAKIRKAKMKKGLTIGGIIATVITIVIVSSVCIANAVKKKNAADAFANSDTGKLVALIQKENNGKDEFYFYVDRDEGCRANFGFEYKKNGWVDEYSITRDFRVYCKLTARSEDHYKETTGFCFFSLDGSDDTKTSHYKGNSACFNSYTTYGTSSHVFTQYQSVTYSGSLNKGNQYYRYDNWDSTYNSYTSEWTERGFLACNLTNTLINQYCQTAFGSSFWK